MSAMQFLPSKRVKWLISKLCFVPSLGQHCKISITVPEEQTSSWLSFHNCLTDHDKKKKKRFYQSPCTIRTLFFLITYKREKKEKKEHHELEGNEDTMKEQMLYRCCRHW